MSDTPGPHDSSQDAQLAELWDQVRKKFATSIMVETSLSSLAQNAEAMDWPIDGDDETPSKYIDFSYDELKLLPEFAPDHSRIGLLVDILHETLAFDDPFGDMAEQIEASTSAGDQTVTRVLEDLQIPSDYPIKLTNLSEESQDLCTAEGIETIGQFAEFAQNMAQNVVIGGDFRAFINALQQCDEEEIGNYLPFRQNHKGLHAPEAFGMVIHSLSEDQKLGLAQFFGVSLTEAEQAKASSEVDTANLVNRLQAKISPILLYFGEERERLSQMVSKGESLDRTFLVLGDETVEKISIGLIGNIFSGKTVTPPKPKKQKGGFFGRLFGK